MYFWRHSPNFLRYDYHYGKSVSWVAQLVQYNTIVDRWTNFHAFEVYLITSFLLVCVHATFMNRYICIYGVTHENLYWNRKSCLPGGKHSAYSERMYQSAPAVLHLALPHCPPCSTSLPVWPVLVSLPHTRICRYGTGSSCQIYIYM